jgi:hypothetical protein
MADSQARVDDLLVRRHVLAQRLRRLLGVREATHLTLREYRALLAEVRRLPADVRPVLRRLSASLPPAQAELASELLTDLEETPTPSETPIGTTPTVIAMHPGAEEMAFVSEPEAAPPADLLHQAARDPETTPEEMGLLWLESFLGLPAEERFPLLAGIARLCPERCAAVIRLEWHAGDLAGDPGLAALCRDCYQACPAPWMEYPRPDAPGPDGAPREAAVGREAWVATVDGTGHLVVIIDRPARGRHTFAVHLIDLWHHGIEDAWGNARADSRTLRAVLAHFSEMRPQVTWRKIDAPLASALIQQAHRFNEQHCQLVPPEFWVWSDLSAGEGRRPASLRRLWRPARR